MSVLNRYGRDSGLVLALVISFLLAGCESKQSGVRASAVVDTLDSGIVQVRNASSGMWASGSEWHLVEELRLGSVDGGGPEMFGSVVDIEIDALGRIYVADGQALEIRVFDVDGSHVRTFGGRGSGPGEFLQLNALTWDHEGNLWALDFGSGNRRWTVFDTAGVYLTSYSRTQTFLMQPWPGGFDTEGRMIDLISQDQLIRHTPGNPQVDTLMLGLDPAEIFELRTENSRTSARVPFAPGPVWHLDREGFVWYGFGSSYRIAKRTLENDTVLILEREYEPRAVTSAELEQSLLRFEGLIEQGMVIDETRIPSTKPAFDGFVIDEEGYLWVFSFETDLESEIPFPALRVFQVFDAQGIYLGEVSSPTGIYPVLYPRISESRLYGVTLNEHGVPYVVALRIEGRD